MADDPDVDDVVTVAEGGVSVEKRFTADDFPVPAVEFVLRSEADDPVEVRLTDSIPQSFDMEGIGFHPEYDGDGWTAYRDHRVEYERTLDPGEAVTTVYGVRLDDPADGTRFLGEPRIERLPPDDDRATPEEILGRETTSAVRDALAGDGDLAPDPDAATAAPGDDGATGSGPLGGADPDAPDEGAGTGPSPDADFDLPEPSGDGDGDAAADVGADIDEAEDGSDGTVDHAAPRPVDDDLAPAVSPVEEGVADADDPGADGDAASAGAAGGDAEGTGAAEVTAVPGSVVAALAAEIRDGAVDEDDLATLRDALGADAGVPRSVEVRIDRLQNRTEDLAAYTGALEEFIDEEGTGREVLDELEAETATLGNALDAVEDELDEAADERATLEAETTALADDRDALDDRLTDAEAAVDGLEDRVADLTDDLDGVRDRVADAETAIEDLAGDTDQDLGDLRDALDDVEATMADLEDEIEDLHSFRDRMRDAFGS